MLTFTARNTKKPISVDPHSVKSVQGCTDNKPGALLRCDHGATFMVAESVEDVTKAVNDATGTTSAAKAAKEPKAKK